MRIRQSKKGETLECTAGILNSSGTTVLIVTIQYGDAIQDPDPERNGSRLALFANRRIHQNTNHLFSQVLTWLLVLLE
jgi:hypothetical protein